MNELQQVLLVFAVVVIAGLYFLSRSRSTGSKKKHHQLMNRLLSNKFRPRKHLMNWELHTFRFHNRPMTA